MPKASGKIDGTTRGIGERQQVDEVAVLQRAGEEHVEALGPRLELGAVVAEADDHRARVEAAQRLEQHVHALVLHELAEVDDGVPVAGEERGEAVGVGVVGQALLRVAGVRRVVARLGDERVERGSRGAGRQRSTSTPGGISCTRSTVPQTSRTTSRMCSEPTTVAAAPARTSPPHADSSALPRIEYSSSEPCALTT